MALFGKKDKTGAVTEGSRFRTFGVFLLVLILIIGGMGYLYYRRVTAGVVAGARIGRAPTVSGAAAAETASPEYVKLIRQQNIEQARLAAQTGEAAISTVVRPSYFDSGDFAAKAKKGCSVADLKRSREAGVAAIELRCRGCSAAALKAAGYTAGELAAAGFSATELKAAGFTAAELKEAGFTAAELKRAGFDVSDLAAAGFTASELAQAGFTPDQLRFAGFTDADLAEAGIGVGTPANMPKDCNVDALKKARAAGISAAQLRKLGCGASALKAAGYTAAELKAAGFNAEQLKAAGFTAQELKAAGFTVGELLKAGYSPKELREAGFSAKELRDAGVSAEDLLAAGYSVDDLKKSGFSDGELYRAGIIDKPTVAAGEKKTMCDVATLRTLRARGVTIAALKAIGCNEEEMKAAGYTAAEIAGTVLPAPKVEAGAAPIITGGTEEERFLQQLQARQQAQLTATQRQDEIDKITSAMRGNASSLFSNWAPPPNQQYEEAEKEKEQEKEKEEKPRPQQQLQQQQAGVPGQPGGQGAPIIGPKTTLKAGTVIYGVFETGVNSDEESPVLATVVSGKYKGARLVGKFKLLDKRLLVNFDKMSLSWYPRSFQVKAVAVDPESARTALAHHVDNHYFLRYGTLFGSSFLSGLATALTTSGSTTSATPAGVVTTLPELSASEKFFVALGEVGTQYANVLGENFNRKPTVTIEAGQAVGFLFLDDTDVPIKTAVSRDFLAN